MASNYLSSTLIEYNTPIGKHAIATFNEAISNIIEQEKEYKDDNADKTNESPD